MTPMPRPPMSYVSVGPYTITHEWPDGEIQTMQADGIVLALRIFVSQHPSKAQAPEDADRSVVFDARGITIFGCNSSGTRSEDWVATHEVLRTLESLKLTDAGMVDLIELELSCLYFEESS